MKKSRELALKRQKLTIDKKKELKQDRPKKQWPISIKKVPIQVPRKTGSGREPYYLRKKDTKNPTSDRYQRSMNKK